MPSKTNNKETPIEVKINKWDGSAVKNALDDAVKDVLTEKFNYQESFALMDGRLALCSVAVGVAMFALLWDYLNPFPKSRHVLIICVISYFVLMGLLSLYTTYKEKGIFVVAVDKTKNLVWEASSYLQKYDDKYNLIINVTDKKTKSFRAASFTKSVANFIDQNGVVLNDLIENEITKIHNSVLSEKKDK
ncbi:probable signal peptidase complex subunit 2 [Chrysoperla carnea]|uniref:probable signal peptidase complex subunit 2 n=1 Tax=Chrysoperla carnea TaxID=189513 RepID=UPI001D094954|nr:probable signal peptidase complex subunit 2 [Chrysoperla carnea]